MSPMESIFNPEIQNRDVSSKIVFALERISQVFRASLWQENKTVGLSPIQMQILVFLYYHPQGYRTVTMLAREFNITKATISDAVRVLENKKYVQKTTNIKDARSLYLLLTRKGEKTAQKLSLYADNLTQIVNDMSKADKDIFYTILLKMIRQLQTAKAIGRLRMCFTCRHLRKNDRGYRCLLLNKALQHSELRINCLEHEE